LRDRLIQKFLNHMSEFSVLASGPRQDFHSGRQGARHLLRSTPIREDDWC
jgi:hypothetical protein